MYITFTTINKINPKENEVLSQPKIIIQNNIPIKRIVAVCFYV